MPRGLVEWMSGTRGKRGPDTATLSIHPQIHFLSGTLLLKGGLGLPPCYTEAKHVALLADGTQTNGTLGSLHTWHSHSLCPARSQSLSLAL